MHIRVLRIAVVILAAAFVASALGCKSQTTRPSKQQEATAVAIEHMAPASKQAIAAGFPIEIPVPAGEVIEGHAQGDDAWDYVIDVDAPAVAVAKWYREAYSNRGWQLVSEEPGSGQLRLTFRKEIAESRVELPAEGDAPTRALVIVGVGARVLETQ